MPISDAALDELFRSMDGDASPIQEPKRGEAIFEGTDYPREWSYFVGQDKAKEQLQIQILSAEARSTRMDHILLASGIHGVGKSTLATLTAYKAGKGLIQTSGQLSANDFWNLTQGMQDGDVLFIDEVHVLVAGNRNKADWILPWMTEGVLYTERGAKRTPNITLIAATTDVGKLPQTLISRFMVQPTIVAYTPEEGAEIAQQLAGRMGVTGLAGDHYLAISHASAQNPRVMRQILTATRDLNFAYPEMHPNLERAFDWSGVSADGLSQIARDVLVLLALATDHTASLESLKANLSEPGPIKHHEQALLQRALVEVTGRGRKLTAAGIQRARQEVLSRR